MRLLLNSRRDSRTTAEEYRVNVVLESYSILYSLKFVSAIYITYCGRIIQVMCVDIVEYISLLVPL